IENSISQNTKSLELADPITYMKLFNEATVTRNPLTTPKFTPNQILNTQAAINNEPGSNPYVFPAVDWLGMLFKKRTSTQRANLSVSGGGGVARYYVSGSYNLDHGNLRQDIRNNNNNNVKFQNSQIRSNVNINITKSTELVVRLSGNFNEYNGPITSNNSFATDLYNVAVHTSPVLFPAYYPADSANLKTQHILFGNASSDGGTGGVAYNNPYALLLRGHKNYSESRMSAQLELNQGLDFITKGLAFHGIFSTNRYSYFDNNMYYNPFYYNVGSYDKPTNSYTLSLLNPQPGAATEYLSYYPGTNNLNTFIYMQGVLEYTRQFGVHNVSSTVVATRQQTQYANGIDPVTLQPSLPYSLPYRNLGVAGRATYSFKSRYFIEFNFGYNGSERFSANHRYGFFPTIGGSWVVSNEKFWDPLSKVVDRLKLRATYGLVGNDAIGSQRFFFLSDVNLNGGNPATFGTNNGYTRPGVYINSYPNPDVTWETSRQTNLGIELSLFKKLNITADFYKQYRYNILMARTSIPTTVGLENQGNRPISANVGTAYSKGIDLHADYKQTFTKDLWTSFMGNLTLTSSRYGNYEEPQYAEWYRYQSGQPIGMGVGYIAERLFVDDKEAANSPTQIFSTNGYAPQGGDIKYRDLNNDGKIDAADLTFIGLPQSPQITYGFGFTSGYKNFDLSAFFQGNARVSFFIDPARVSPFIQSPDTYYTGNTQLLKAFADNHWSEANQNLYALYPRLGINGGVIENNRQNSTWWMRDGSFMRLKSLEVGYTIPQRLLKRMQISNFRIYFNGLNLITWSTFKLWDPELGGNAFSYPIQKVFNGGINVNF
ncbi:MAG: SusC/RagA family TonB-linked outer membrane protein, partial [Segetibacter sp.]|nr:SusC/RagA family TonB-linked outer membrane protein [Segetibacter sp.]